MPVLTDEPTPPALSPPFMVLVILAAGVFVYLAYHSMRGQPAWGMEGETLLAAAWATGGLFVAAGALGAWVERRRRARLN